MALTDTEREDLEREIVDELEAEHHRRLEKLSERKQRVSSKAERSRNLEKAELKEAVQARFYEERGYKLYTDSTGRQVWLPAEEYDYRMKSRPQRRRRNRVRREWGGAGSLKMGAFWVAMVVIAVFFGVMLAT